MLYNISPQVMLVLRPYFYFMSKENTNPDTTLQRVSKSLGIARSAIESVREEKYPQDHTTRGRDGTKLRGNHEAKVAPGTTLLLGNNNKEFMNRERCHVTSIAPQPWLASEPIIRLINPSRYQSTPVTRLSAARFKSLSFAEESVTRP